MINPRSQNGFTLVAAIFLLVVVAALVVFMTNARVIQQTTLVYGVQGARAMQAARSGLEWGIYQALTNVACPPATPFSLDGPALDDFEIRVSCSSTVHWESDASLTTFRLTSVASSGTYGTLDYVQRRVRATVSEAPP